VKNFGIVLAKSVLKGVPQPWELQRRKIVSSLVAVRDRAPESWPDLSQTIVRLIDNLEPENRNRAITFIASFPDFWAQLQAPTMTALEETAENTDAAQITDYRMLAAVTLPQFRDALLGLIDNLGDDRLRDAIEVEPLDDLWPHAVEKYESSGSYRGSEVNFREFIAPFSGRLNGQQHDQLLDAIIENGQNWAAADTPSLLLGFLKNANVSDYPTRNARDRFYVGLRDMRRVDRYDDTLELLQADRWSFPP
jgi:hypothetical protein